MAAVGTAARERIRASEGAVGGGRQQYNIGRQKAVAVTLLTLPVGIGHRAHASCPTRGSLQAVRKRYLPDSLGSSRLYTFRRGQRCWHATKAAVKPYNRTDDCDGSRSPKSKPSVALEGRCG